MSSKLSKYFKSDSGFTLIELLISVAIITIVSFVGIASFNNANRRNATTQAAADITSLARKLRTDATSGLKPTAACKAAGVTLAGYYLVTETDTNDYWYGPACFDASNTFVGAPQAGHLSEALIFNHTFLGLSQYTAVMFAFNGNMYINSTTSATAFSQDIASYDGTWVGIPVAFNNMRISYAADDTEKNYIYFSDSGLICYQRLAPSLGNNCVGI